MSDTPRAREFQDIRREMEALALRIRSLESLEAPMQRQIIERFQKLLVRVDLLEAFGAPIRAEGIKRELEDIVADIHEIKEDQRAIRATVRSALITAAFGIASSIIVGTILYILLQRGPSR